MQEARIFMLGLSKIGRAAPKKGLKCANRIIIITYTYSNVMAKSVML